jgi:hypothetical protein
MPFITSLGSVSLFGFGFSKKVTAEGGGGDTPYTGSLYYYEGGTESDTTSTWATLAKWYKDSEHTQTASALPTESNVTTILNNTSANLATWTAPASIHIAGHTLELIAHTEEEGCAAAVVFSTTVTGASLQDGGTLTLNGHITIAA